MLRDAVFHAEREASRADARNPAVGDEERDWRSALADGAG